MCCLGDGAFTPEHIDPRAVFENPGIRVIYHLGGASQLNIRKDGNGGRVLELPFAEGFDRYVIDYAVLLSKWHMSPIVLGNTVILIVETWEFNDPDADVAAFIAGL